MPEKSKPTEDPVIADFFQCEMWKCEYVNNQNSANAQKNCELSEFSVDFDFYDIECQKHWHSFLTEYVSGFPTAIQ